MFFKVSEMFLKFFIMQPVERAFRMNYKTFFFSPEFLVAFNLRRKLSKL